VKNTWHRTLYTLGRKLTRMQIESKLDKMQHILAVGISPREIMKALQLTERNYHWYRKKLENRTFHQYYNRQQESYQKT
jgi:hypothetical protein